MRKEVRRYVDVIDRLCSVLPAVLWAVGRLVPVRTPGTFAQRAGMDTPAQLLSILFCDPALFADLPGFVPIDVARQQMGLPRSLLAWK